MVSLPYLAIGANCRLSTDPGKQSLLDVTSGCCVFWVRFRWKSSLEPSLSQDGADDNLENKTQIVHLVLALKESRGLTFK